MIAIRVANNKVASDEAIEHLCHFVFEIQSAGRWNSLRTQQEVQQITRFAALSARYRMEQYLLSLSDYAN